MIRKLDITKSLEFSTSDGHQVDQDHDQQGDGVHAHQQRTLDYLAIAKNRRLETELTSLRIRHHDTSQELSLLRTQAIALQQERVQLRVTIQQLEGEVTVLRDRVLMNPHMSVNPISQNCTPEHSPVQSPGTQSSSLIPILVAQRDRLQVRNLELEESGKALLQELNTMRSVRAHVDHCMLTLSFFTSCLGGSPITTLPTGPGRNKTGKFDVV